VLCSKCSRDILPVVVVDVDGVLGKYHEQFRNFAMNYLNVNLPRGYNGSTEYSDYLGLEKTIYRQIKLAYRQGGIKRWMPVYDGASEFMQHLSNMEVEVWIATTRPWDRLDNIDPDLRHWLDRNKMPYDYLLYGEDKFLQLSNQINPERVIAVIEDQKPYCDEAEAIFGDVVWQPLREHTHGAAFREGRRFASWDSVLVDVEVKVKRWISR